MTYRSVNLLSACYNISIYLVTNIKKIFQTDYFNSYNTEHSVGQYEHNQILKNRELYVLTEEDEEDE
jgi:hypothetical protein